MVEDQECAGRACELVEVNVGIGPGLKGHSLVIRLPGEAVELRPWNSGDGKSAPLGSSYDLPDALILMNPFGKEEALYATAAVKRLQHRVAPVEHLALVLWLRTVGESRARLSATLCRPVHLQR
jgi:hypothetical protein